MWPAEIIMQSMRPAMLCRFPTPAVKLHGLASIQSRSCVLIGHILIGLVFALCFCWCLLRLGSMLD